MEFYFYFASSPNWHQTFISWQDSRLFWCFGKEIRKNVFNFTPWSKAHLLSLKKRKKVLAFTLLCFNGVPVPTGICIHEPVSFYVFVVPLMSRLHQLEMKPSFFSLTYSYLCYHKFPLKSLGDIHRMWERGDKNLAFSTLNMFKIVTIQFPDMKGKNGLE